MIKRQLILTLQQIVNGNKTENVASIDRDPANVTPSFLSLLKLVGDPGHCWVSPNCFPPLAFVEGATNLIAAQPALIVYYNTVVKSVTTSDDGSTITSLSAIQRTPLPNMTCNGYDQFLSQVCCLFGQYLFFDITAPSHTHFLLYKNKKRT